MTLFAVTSTRTKMQKNVKNSLAEIDYYTKQISMQGFTKHPPSKC